MHVLTSATVFVASTPVVCLDRLEYYAGSNPTVVLVELDDARQHASSAVPTDSAAPLPFLRALAADVQCARYQRHVMPFALLHSESSGTLSPLDTEFTAGCLNAGAVEVIRSPLAYEDVNRLVGHVKETLRPAARLLGASMAGNLVRSIRDSSPTRVARHRPDQTIPEARKNAIENAVGQWHFHAHEFGMDELTYAALFMVEHMLQRPELRQYALPRAELVTFLLATRRQYKHHKEVHYHNWRHAVDVTQSIYCFLLDVRLCQPLPTDQRQMKHINAIERIFRPIDGLILLVSAIGHDVGHPGVNNAFLVACDHPLAQLYNDKSVLENYHCAAYSQLLRRHWPSLSNLPRCRSTMISNILATDMQRHFEYMAELGKLKQKVESSELDLSDWNTKDFENARELMMALLMKAADISNVARPFDISAHWATILMNEFSRQGELESELGIPTCLFGGPPDKEDALGAAESQKGFMNLFGIPLFSGMQEIMPSLSCAGEELKNNQKIWDEKISHERERRASEGDNTHLTFSSVTQTEVDEANMRNIKSERVAAVGSASVDVSSMQANPVTNNEPSPKGNPAMSASPMAAQDDKHSPASYLPAPQVPIPPSGGSSRRSSKDVALDQLQQLNALTHQNVSTNSRRGSADPNWQVHQNYPGSRRGSKDESLTTILVTSQGSPRRGSPSSPSKYARGAGSPGKQSTKRHSVAQSQQQAASRGSVPSSRSNTTSSAAATTTTQQSASISTQSSSIAATDDDSTPPANTQSNMVTSEDPFLVPGKWPNDVDGAGPRHSVPVVIPSTPPLSSGKTKNASPRIIARMASGESDENGGGRGAPTKTDPGLRESRSRSRLRGLKFWKKKRDISGLEIADSGSP